MYCFAKFCQICFYRPDTKLININKLDYDKIRIKEKLKCCIPEATFDVNLICVTCCVNLRRSYTFKQMCMENQGKLNKYASILEQKVTKSKPQINSPTDLEVQIEVSKEIVSLMMLHNEDVKEEEPVSLNKIPLNEWDSFETKYTCRCTKELGYGTNNLCSKCEGDLLGFQLSKIKVAFTNAGHNSSFIKQESDDNTDSDSDSMDSVYHEIGFDDDDIQYSISYSNDVNNMLEDYENNQHGKEDDESESDESSEASDNIRHHPTYKQFQCPLCDKGFTRRYNLHQHYISHRNANVLNCPYCNEWFVRPIDFENHRRTHIKAPSIKKIFRHDKESNDFIPIEIEVPDLILNGADESITCATCDMSFTHKSRLAVHLLTHKKQFLCVECNKDFFRKDVYDAHIRTHLFEGKKYVCAICHDSFELASVFIRHVKDHAENDHYDDENLSKQGGGEDEALKKYPCGLCSKSYNYSSNLYRHMKRHNDYDYKPVVSPYLQNLSSPLRPYRCSECPKGYNHLSNLQRHMKTHADVNYLPANVLLRKDNIMMDSTESLDTLENRFCCTECDRSYNRLSNLQRHMRSHADASYIPRRSKTKPPEGTQNVDSENSLPNEYICTECNKSYSHLSSLQRHMKNHSNNRNHQIEMKNEEAPIIKQEEVEDPVIIKQEPKFDLDEDEKMLIHLSRQTDEGNLEISEPEISTLTYENLAQHTNNTPLEEEHHSHRKAFYSDASSNSITSQKKYQCCECDKSYNHSANLHRHLKTHNTARHVCTICFREFVRKDVFEKHFKTHAFQKIDELFSCKVCKRAFSYKQNLKRHMRTHPGYEDDALSSRSQVCPICKERVNNSLMRKHMLIHSYQKDLDAPQSSTESATSATYKCNECSKVYLTHSSLVRHIFSHST